MLRYAEGMVKAGAQIVRGASPQEKRATELAAADAALRIKQQQLEGAVSAGAKGRGVEVLRQQVATLQAEYYRLAEAAVTAAAAEERALARTPPPAHRAANDITPQLAAGVAQTKWINDQRDAYDRLNEAMQGTPVQRQLNIAALNAEREAIERGLNPAQQAALIDLRRNEALLQLNTAVSDESARLGLLATDCTEIDAEMLASQKCSAIIMDELSCLL